MKDESVASTVFPSSFILHPSSFRIAAADEVYDLDAVAFVERDARPFGAAYDFAVQLDGDALGREREAHDEFGERRALFRLFLFAVDSYLQALPLPTGG